MGLVQIRSVNKQIILKAVQIGQDRLGIYSVYIIDLSDRTRQVGNILWLNIQIYQIGQERLGIYWGKIYRFNRQEKIGWEYIVLKSINLTDRTQQVVNMLFKSSNLTIGTIYVGHIVFTAQIYQIGQDMLGILCLQHRYIRQDKTCWAYCVYSIDLSDRTRYVGQIVFTAQIYQIGQDMLGILCLQHRFI